MWEGKDRVKCINTINSSHYFLCCCKRHAIDSMAEDAAGEHLQEKLVKAQPTAEAAEVRQGILVDIRINYCGGENRRGLIFEIHLQCSS
jgi:hypothetical protein